MSKTIIFVAGHKGMVGSALVRFLQNKDIELLIRNRNELDLLNQKDVQNFFKKQKVDQVYLAAAKVGGIYANNTYPADFIYQNLTIQTNVIHSAFLAGVKKLLFLGSSCIYPKNVNQPIKEDSLLTGELEATNEPYSIAKIAGLKMCESYNRQYKSTHNIDYRTVMPTNLYGPGDNYHATESHVIAGLIRKFHEAKIYNNPYVTVWGTGKAKREFLHVDDFVRACHIIMNLDYKIFYKKNKLVNNHINVGSGEEVTIQDLAIQIKNITKYLGKIKFDRNKLTGQDKKFLSCKKIYSLGWKPKISLKNGLTKVYENFKNQYENSIKNI